jgi:hypothetical protein
MEINELIQIINCAVADAVESFFKIKTPEINRGNIPKKAENRVKYHVFFSRCGDCGKALQEALRQNFKEPHSRALAGKTMTVSSKGQRLCRISNAGYGPEEIGEIRPDVLENLQKLMPYHLVGQIMRIPPEVETDFIDTVVQALLLANR